MIIELEDLLVKYLNGGINLFLGAGFSIYSENKEKNRLPLGRELAAELHKKFKCPPIEDLPKICTVIDSYDKDGLRNYLINRFTVSSYDEAYSVVPDINAKRIFTTNIDNLVHKIYSKGTVKYINDILMNGAIPGDLNCVDYIPIHGSILNEESEFLFNIQEVSSSFRTQRNAWEHLKFAANESPSLFIGYGFADVGAIQSLYGETRAKSIERKHKWILLHESDESAEAYFKALGFKIIVGDVKDFLIYLKSVVEKDRIVSKEKRDYILDIYPEAKVPLENQIKSVRKIDDFFLGSPPIWSDILSNRIYTTSHLDIVRNLLEKHKKLIVTGIPTCGKSTLMMQLARQLRLENQKILLFNAISTNKARIIANEINSETFVFMDNFSADIDSFLLLSGNRHIRLVGFDRYYSLDMNYHRIDVNEFSIYDMSELTPHDVQGIYEKIPPVIRKPMNGRNMHQGKSVSTFELVNYYISTPNINERFRSILSDLEKNDSLLLEVLVMVCYLHECRTSVSFDVLNNFLDDEVDSYHDVLEIREALRGLVLEVPEIIDSSNKREQDYYSPRSTIFSETVLSQIPNKVFARVYELFHELVPKHVIPHYNIFKRFAYDSRYCARSFPNWEKGLSFYYKMYGQDKSPYILQQCALYLLSKKQYRQAGIEIDKAMQGSKKRHFSIENTHAIIMFQANIQNASGSKDVLKTLDDSMELLNRCYQEDKKKNYHAYTFTRQALDYYKVYPGAKAMQYLENAEKWLNLLLKENRKNRIARNLLKKVKLILT